MSVVHHFGEYATLASAEQALGKPVTVAEIKEWLLQRMEDCLKAEQSTQLVRVLEKKITESVIGTSELAIFSNMNLECAPLPQ